MYVLAVLGGLYPKPIEDIDVQAYADALGHGEEEIAEEGTGRAAADHGDAGSVFECQLRFRDTVSPGRRNRIAHGIPAARPVDRPSGRRSAALYRLTGSIPAS